MMSLIRIGAAISGLLILGFFWTATKGCSCNPKWKAYRASVKSDLRNLVTAEESYFADSISYTLYLDSTRFRPSTGVRYRVVEASDSGWAALALHPGALGRCAIYVGKVAERLVVADSVGREGEPYCDIRQRPD